MRRIISLGLVFFWLMGGVALASVELGIEGPLGPASVISDGSWYAGSSGYWTMYATDNPMVDLPGVVTLPHTVPEYHWWNGCSPTAAGMLFAYWDTYFGKSNLYAGDSTVWDKVNMNMNNPADYTGTHSMVASWGHRAAGMAQGLTYGTWDRNGNGIVDDQASWDSLADFMRTVDGGTSRNDMPQGFLDFAAFNGYTGNVAVNDWSPTLGEYQSEILAGYPVHVGITGHSILGFGYWYGQTPWHSSPTWFVVNWTTWGGGWDLKWGLIELSEVYAYTTLRVGEYVGEVPEPASLAVWSVLTIFGMAIGWRARRAR